LKIEPAKNKRHRQNQCKEHNSIGRQPKSIGSVIDASAIEGLSSSVALDGNAAYGNESKESEDKLAQSDFG
jgi:hypothetical protein